MPLVKRTVEPIFIGRSILDSHVKNELEGVVINSLAGVIKQLSSLSKHAENLFGDLVNEANAIFQRSTSLGQRVQHLYERTSQLDSATKEEVKVEDFSFQSHFKSSRKEEQQILSRSTLPQALQEVYRSCTAPPDLNNFTNYRDDGKQGLKFYTDPTYFYNLWVSNQNKILDKKKRKGDKRKRQKKSHTKKQVKQVQKKTFAGVDVEFKDTIPKSSAEPVVSDTSQTAASSASQQGYTESYAQEHRPSGPAPQPTPAQLSAPGAPPPPPPLFNPPGAPAPPPFPSHPDVPAPPPPPSNVGYQPVSAAPPPPSLPAAMQLLQQAVAPPLVPVMMMSNVPAPPPPPITAGPAPPAPPPAPSMPPASPEPVAESRSDLLRAIEMGKKLRKVERSDDLRQQSHGQDVASILKRRIVMEVSDTESDSDSDDTDSDWSN